MTDHNIVEAPQANANTLITTIPTGRDWQGIPHTARFILRDGNLLPCLSDTEHRVSLQIGGFPLDPRLQLSIPKTEYPMSLELRAGDIKAISVVDTSDTSFTVLDVQLEFEHCITIGLTKTHDDNVIDDIRQHMFIASSGYELNFKIFVDKSNSQDDLTDLLESLPKLNKLPWYPYRYGYGPVKTQYGRLASRETVKKASESGEIMQVPSSNHFYDVAEASVKLVYGAHLEHEVSMFRLQGLAQAEHRITIFNAPGSDLRLGAIKFGKLPKNYASISVADMLAPVPDGTSCVVSVQGTTDKWVGYDAVVTPSVINLPTSCNLTLLLLPSGKGSSFENQLGEVNQPERQYPCKLRFELHNENVKAQIEAVNAVCSSNFSRWHPILLNHDYAALGRVDIFQALPQTEIQRAYKQVYAMKRWNKKQLEVFQMMRGVPGDGFAFVEGIFGCGKTLVQAVLAKLLVDLGKHVLIVAPTNAALQAISETLLKETPDLSAVRVVFAGAEDAKKFNQENDEQSHTGSKELAVFRLLKDMNAFRNSRYNVAPEHDLQVHVEKLVKEMSERGEKLLFKYQPESDLNDERPEAVDAIVVYSKFKSTNFSRKPNLTTKEEEKSWKKNKQLFAQALERLQAKVISSTKLLLCTQQMASSRLVRGNFASDGSDGIVVIADEDGQSLEPVAWIPIVLLKNCKHIQAVLRFGDRLQLAPLALSATSKFSEFGGQISRSLFDRHLQYHEPVTSLDVQYRMHPVLSQFPNTYTYNGRLRDGEGCEQIEVDAVFAERLIEWARPHLADTPEDDFARLLGVSVRGAEVVINSETSSRSNPKNAKVVFDMLSTIFKEKPYPTSTITIMTSYNAQKALHLKMIRNLQQQTGLPFNRLPRVATIDSMQGHESDIVILDWVNGYGRRLGFLTDNRRSNVALTRARASMIVLFHREFSVYEFYNSELFEESKPDILRHWDYLVKKGRIVRVKKALISAPDDEDDES